MLITFARTGGLVAAPGLGVRAAVALDAAGGEVTMADGYRRTLDSAEGTALFADAEEALAAIERRGGVSPTASHHGSPDAFRLDVTISADNSRMAVVASDAAELAAIPALARLSEWAAREADAIVRHRFEGRL